MKPKEYYEEMLRAQQHEIAAQIARLRAKRWEIQKEAEQEFDQQIDRLQQMRDEVDSRMKALMDAGEESWHDFEQTISAAYETVAAAAQRTLERFSKTQLSKEEPSRTADKSDETRR